VKTPDKDSIRSAFEYWFSDQGKYPRAIERHGEVYMFKHAQDAWQVWQAAWDVARQAAGTTKEVKGKE